jgi:hypothetical protein
MAFINIGARDLKAHHLTRSAASRRCMTVSAHTPTQLPNHRALPPAPRSSVGGIQSP